MLNADLHCHSMVSDGVLAPIQLAEMAHANGVTLWSLTDHDEVGGQIQARTAAEALGLIYVCGVEISVTWANQTLHVVGLNIDPFCGALVDGLAATRGGRAGRAQAIGSALERAGIAGAYEGALRYVGNPDLISRTHFARYLHETGCLGPGSTIQQVFDAYLKEGRPGYVPHRWAKLADAVGWIRTAGGVAVIAHPGRYAYTELQMQALYDEFKQLGGVGIEVVTGSHTPDQYAQYAHVARQYGFLASRGSDFHGTGESRANLGQLPLLPQGLTPIWHAWQ